MKCPTCHTLNESDAHFCKSCGASLMSDSGQLTKPLRRFALRRSLIGGGLLVVLGIAAVLYLWLRPTPDEVINVDPAIGMTWSPADDEAQLDLLPEGLTGPLKLRARAVSTAQIPLEKPEDDPLLTQAVNQLPDNLDLQSPVYRFELVAGLPPSIVRFSHFFSDTAGAPHTLDLYAWDEKTGWRWLPSHVSPDSRELTTQLESLPEIVALMQSEPNNPIITADLGSEASLPAVVEGALTERLLTGFYLQPDGSLKADESLPDMETTIALIPSLRNWRGGGIMAVDTGLILADPTLRRRQIDAVVGLALAGGYPAVQLDYRGLDPVQRPVFSTFITELAATLHDQGRFLLVRVEAPVRVATTRWETETGAYDWAVIGQAADRLQVPLPIDPTAPEQVEAFLTWAVGQVNRSRLQPILSLPNLDVSGEPIAPLPAMEALAQLGPLRSSREGEPIVSGDPVTLSLTGLAGGILEVDPASEILHFVGADNRQFYLQTDASFSRWLQRVIQYNLAGIVLESMLDESLVGQTWPLVQAYRALDVPKVENEPVWLWTVTETDDPTNILSEKIVSLEEISYNWTASDTPGEYKISVALSIDGGTSTLPVASLSLRVPPTPTPTPITTPTPISSPTPIFSPTPTLPPRSSVSTTEIATPPPSRPTSSPSAFLLAYTKWDGQFHNLYIADTRTGQEQLILTRAAGPSFSPDKKRLFYFGEQGVNQQIRDNRVACDFGTISEGIVAVDLPSPLRDICQVQADAWTCQRKEIDIGLGPSDVCTANNVSVYQNLDWKVGSARWTKTSPTGDSVAFDAKPGEGYRIYFRAVNPTSQQFHFEIPGEQASWSPDGEKLVYRSGRNNQAGLWISNRDDSNPIQLTENGTDSFPAWSPDGQTIVFSREVDGDVELGAINIDGSNLRRLTHAKGPDTLPVFTPSGEIIFRSGRSGSWGIWKMQADGSDQTEIIPNAPVSHLDWAFDRMDVK